MFTRILIKQNIWFKKKERKLEMSYMDFKKFLIKNQRIMIYNINKPSKKVKKEQI